MGRMKSLIGVLVALLLLVAGAGIAGAAVLAVDRSHGQGQVDLSGLTGALGPEWTVVDLTLPMTDPESAKVLKTCNLLVVPQPLSDFTDAEVQAVHAWVEAEGGGLWVLYDAGAPQPYLNKLPAAFGVTFNTGVVTEFNFDTFEFLTTLTIAVPSDLQTNDDLFFGGVPNFVYYKGTSLNADPSLVSVVVTASPAAFSDDGTYSASPPVLAAADVGTGHVVFIGDTTPLESSTYSSLDDGTKRLLNNIVSWLKRPDSSPVPTTKEVTINIIRPWNRHNTVSLNARGFIRVAIMSDANFNAADVDPKSVVFAGASPVCWKLQKVNRDHQKDLVLVFWIADLVKDSDNENGLTCDSNTVDLTGTTNDGTTIHGSDSVQIEPTGKCKKQPKHENCGGKKGK
ncbi:MAG TPA: hypothetical protein VMU60_11935 [Syntrophobacteria bacterium]|nr:hypothetical protein [Syntrophobacteria bacterium]